MVHLDDDIHGGLERLVAEAPEPVEWSAVDKRRRLLRRRRTITVGAGAIGVMLALVASVGWLSRDDTTVVAGPTEEAVPCGAWVAVHTLFDSSQNTKTPAGGVPTIANVTAEQAAFLVKSGDVPDRVARELGGDAGELSTRVVARPNTQLGTIEITAWGDSPNDAKGLSDAFAGALLASVQDIQQREIDRQRDVLTGAITQLEFEIAGATGDQRTVDVIRERLSADIAGMKVQLQELDQAAAQGSNIYSFGSAESYRVDANQAQTLFGEENPGVEQQTC